MTLKDMVRHNGNGNSNGETSNLPVRHEDTSQSQLPSIYNEMTQWMDEWNRRFDSLFGRAFDLSLRSGQALMPFSNMTSQLSNWTNRADWGNQWNSFVPAVNISESVAEYRVSAELPGMDERDVGVSLSKGSLLIKGEKKAENEDKGKGYYRMERSYGTFQRVIPLSQEVDAEKVDATFNKGLLTITLPKLPTEQTGAKKIAIKTEQ